MTLLDGLQTGPNCGTGFNSLNSMNPSDVEFMAMEELIHIVPRVRMGRISLIGGDYGPFKPPQRTIVPLWLALELRRRGLCEIEIPEWLQPEVLNVRLSEEKSIEQFTPLPSNIFPVAHLLLSTPTNSQQQSSIDSGTAVEIRQLLQELMEVRGNKILKGIESMNHRAVKMNNITSMELTQVRAFMLQAFSSLESLESI